MGPATVLVVLGIELDSVSQIAHLPAEKLSALKDLISFWLSRKCCNRRELESHIGHLLHAAKVVWPGRTFLRRMIDSCAASARGITQFASLRSFTWTCAGGTSSCYSGTGLAFGSFQVCPRKLTWSLFRCGRIIGLWSVLKGLLVCGATAAFSAAAVYRI